MFIQQKYCAIPSILRILQFHSAASAANMHGLYRITNYLFGKDYTVGTLHYNWLSCPCLRMHHNLQHVQCTDSVIDNYSVRSAI